MSSRELTPPAPCPFCGCSIITLIAPLVGQRAACCEYCEAQGPMVETTGERVAALALELWNRRAGQPGLGNKEGF